MSFLPSNLSLYNKRKGEKGSPSKAYPGPPCPASQVMHWATPEGSIPLGDGEVTPLESHRVVASPVTPSCSKRNGWPAFSATSQTRSCFFYLCSQIPLLETSTTALKVLLLVYFLKHNKIPKGGHAAPCLPAQVNRSSSESSPPCCVLPSLHFPERQLLRRGSDHTLHFKWHTIKNASWESMQTNFNLSSLAPDWTSPTHSGSVSLHRYSLFWLVLEAPSVQNIRERQ